MLTHNPKVPDPQKLDAVQNLCLYSDPYKSSTELDELFVKAMVEIVAWHYERSEFYRALLDAEKFSNNQIGSREDCCKIPHVFAVFCKTHELLSISKEQVTVHLTSSGTTGQKSQIFFDDWSLSSAQKMVDYIFCYYSWNCPKEPCNYLLFSYEPKQGMNVGTSYTDNFLCKYAPINKVFYALRNNGKNGHEFDYFGTIEKLIEYEKEKLPIRIFGFPAFLYFTLEKMNSLNVAPLKFPKNSLVFLGGGWKKNSHQAVSKQVLYKSVTTQLGIPDERIRDGFGSVEHCVPYIECRCHNFHVPVWSQVFIRDVRTLEVLGKNKPGLLHFVSPYITSMPFHSVIMSDIASLHSHEECGCGLKTDFFQVHGRAGTSLNRSCAISAAELLKGK